jgi:hypothetical protein
MDKYVAQRQMIQEYFAEFKIAHLEQIPLLVLGAGTPHLETEP